jgi:hypothetical protein
MKRFGDAHTSVARYLVKDRNAGATYPKHKLGTSPVGRLLGTAPRDEGLGPTSFPLDARYRALTFRPQLALAYLEC